MFSPQALIEAGAEGRKVAQGFSMLRRVGGNGFNIACRTAADLQIADLKIRNRSDSRHAAVMLLSKYELAAQWRGGKAGAVSLQSALERVVADVPSILEPKRIRIVGCIALLEGRNDNGTSVRVEMIPHKEDQEELQAEAMGIWGALGSIAGITMEPPKIVPAATLAYKPPMEDHEHADQIAGSLEQSLATVLPFYAMLGVVQCPLPRFQPSIGA